MSFPVRILSFMSLSFMCVFGLHWRPTDQWDSLHLHINLPEVSVHAAMNWPSIVVRADAFVVTPGAADVAGEFEHHRRGEAVWTGQDVSGCAESCRPGADHRHPLQHRPQPENTEVKPLRKRLEGMGDMVYLRLVLSTFTNVLYLDDLQYFLFMLLYVSSPLHLSVDW